MPALYIRVWPCNKGGVEFCRTQTNKLLKGIDLSLKSLSVEMLLGIGVKVG